MESLKESTGDIMEMLREQNESYMWIYDRPSQDFVTSMRDNVPDADNYDLKTEAVLTYYTEDEIRTKWAMFKLDILTKRGW